MVKEMSAEEGKGLALTLTGTPGSDGPGQEEESEKTIITLVPNDHS